MWREISDSFSSLCDFLYNKFWKICPLGQRRWLQWDIFLLAPIAVGKIGAYQFQEPLHICLLTWKMFFFTVGSSPFLSVIAMCGDWLFSYGTCNSEMGKGQMVHDKKMTTLRCDPQSLSDPVQNLSNNLIDLFSPGPIGQKDPKSILNRHERLLMTRFLERQRARCAGVNSISYIHTCNLYGEVHGEKASEKSLSVDGDFEKCTVIWDTHQRISVQCHMIRACLWRLCDNQSSFQTSIKY